MRKQRLFVLLTVIVIITLDQLTKLLSLSFLRPGTGLEIISGALEFCYVENRGAAFGLLQDHRWIFMSLTAVAIVAMLGWIMLKKSGSRLLTVAFTLIIGGGIGNMIDRVFRGFVIDFINVTFIDFYVFNIADCAVVIGCGMLILYIVTDLIKAGKNK